MRRTFEATARIRKSLPPGSKNEVPTDHEEINLDIEYSIL